MQNKHTKKPRMRDRVISSFQEVFEDLNRQVRSNIVRAKDLQTELVKTYHEGEKPGERIGFESLHPHLRWVKGYQYCFTGYPGSGKSEFLNHLSVIQATYNNRKIALFSPESYPIRSLVNTLMRCYLGKNVSRTYRNCASEDEYMQAMNFVHDHWFLMDYKDIPRLDQLLMDFKLLIESEGVEICIIDPFNAVAEGAHMGEGSNISKYLKVALTQTKMFATDNEILFWIVEHPRSPQLGKDAKIPLASPWTLYGGSMWWDKMDCIVSTAKEDPYTEIRVWKMKDQRNNGKPNPNDPVSLYFDVRANRFLENAEVNQDHEGNYHLDRSA